MTTKSYTTSFSVVQYAERAGKQVKLDVALHSAELVATSVKGAVKPGGPPAVAIECTFLDGGKLKVVFAYYSEASSKLETVTCMGSLTEIEEQVRQRQLPARVQELVDVASSDEIDWGVYGRTLRVRG